MLFDGQKGCWMPLSSRAEVSLPLSYCYYLLDPAGFTYVPAIRIRIPGHLIPGFEKRAYAKRIQIIDFNIKECLVDAVKTIFDVLGYKTDSLEFKRALKWANSNETEELMVNLIYSSIAVTNVQDLKVKSVILSESMFAAHRLTTPKYINITTTVSSGYARLLNGSTTRINGERKSFPTRNYPSMWDNCARIIGQVFHMGKISKINESAYILSAYLALKNDFAQYLLGTRSEPDRLELHNEMMDSEYTLEDLSNKAYAELKRIRRKKLYEMRKKPKILFDAPKR